MKRVIWIFGESATGKKTLIENLIGHKDDDLLKQLGLQDKKIEVVKLTIEETNESFDDKNNEIVRNNKILKEVEEFINSDGEILLIKGQANDMDDRYGNTLKAFAEKFPNIEKEIYLLEVKDLDLLYERIINKSWFKEDEERYARMFPRAWIDKAVIKHKIKVESYIQYGFRITEIDSTKDYIIKEKGIVNNG